MSKHKHKHKHKREREREQGTLGDLVGGFVATQCVVVTEAETALREGVNVIHRTRVAARRLRSTLRVFDDVFEAAAAAWLDAELSWYASVLGAVRDLEVLEERLGASLDALPEEMVLGPVRAELAETVATRRRAAQAAMVEALDSERYRTLAEALARWQDAPPFTAAANRPVARAAKYVARAEDKVTRRLDEAVSAYRADDPEAGELLHRARKSGKRHRYAVEALEPIWGARAAKVVASRKELQELLGDHQDSVVASEFLRDLGAADGGGGRNGFTWGLLYAREQAGGDAVIKKLKKFR